MSDGGIIKNQVIIIGASKLTKLATAYGLQNVKIINGKSNPYVDKIPGEITPDDPLYQSALGTPIYADLTLGDPVNSAANAYTDNGGILRKFTAMTFQTVLLVIQQTKNVEATKIQGAPGTIKEYIGLGDYQVSINGIIPGSNGRYPQDEAAQLKQILESPIALAAVAWWLQIYDIHNLVITDFNIPQLPGEYSQQPFSINALSDYNPEAKFIPSA